MTAHFQKEIEKIKKNIISLGKIVENRIQFTQKAVTDVDAEVANTIIKTDREIDETEVELEEDCLKIIALYQPVAIDLRFLIAVIKINNDLERIGDEAVNIARRIVSMEKRSEPQKTFDYTEMSKQAENMVRKSLNALINMDVQEAEKVRLMDDKVDKMQIEAFKNIKKLMGSQPDHLGYLMAHVFIARHLERIADHATNIAEEVIYMVDGEIVRHQKL